MISAEELLKPITDAKPCGDDLYSDPSFQELESMMKGKLETRFSTAEDPDWKALRNRTEAGAVDVVTVGDGPK